MTESLFSTYWYRVAHLKPILGNALQISRHVYRGQTWYILRNPLNGINQRFNAAAYGLIARLDGQHTVQQLWEHSSKDSVEAVPTQDEVIQLLSRLYDADFIQSGTLPNLAELGTQAQTQPWKQRVSNPFAVRFPLFNPDRFLDRWVFLAAPLFTRTAFVLWLMIVLTAVIAAGQYWGKLTHALSDHLFSTNSLLLLWLTFPFVKILHELGHAFAVKKWGGEVHEMGILLLALTPIPYVDASASAAFTDKRHRMGVASMGMMVELLLASLALFVWINVENGWISTIAFNVMLIGGVSTVVFNGNPLLRYDGYYILADLIEIPSLGERSTRYLGYCLQRYLLGIESVETPVNAPGEKGWFLIYGPIAFAYRIAVVVALIYFVSSRFFMVGVLIALWGAFSLLMLPGGRALFRFLNSPATRTRRHRLVAAGGGTALVLILLFFVFPMPLWTTTQGVVWLPEQSVIRAGTDCEVVEVIAKVDQWVDRDAALIRGSDPFLEAESDIYRARLRELYANYNSQPLNERVKRKMLLEEIDLVRGDLQQTEEKLKKLLIRSPTEGTLEFIDARRLPGLFVKQGQLLGYIITDQHPTIRTVVSQTDIGLVRERVTGIEVRLAEKPAVPYRAEIVRIVPAAGLNLPSAALGTTGGGVIPVDPTDPEGLRAIESHFQLDLWLPDAARTPYLGSRAHVRFEHGSMPLIMQWFRSLRQLFLRRFNA